MSFTIVRPEANARGTIKRPRANKYFIDGVEVIQPRGESPYWWSIVKSIKTDNPLPEIYKELLEIERENRDYVILAEPLTNSAMKSEWVRLKQGDYFVKDYPRNWIQLDFDSGPSGCNSLPISQRLDAAISGLPQAFQTCECVAQLSSKAFHPDYPDYFGLRVYFALKAPYTNAQLRLMLNGLPFVDASVFSNVRRHYTSVLYEGTKQPEVIGERVMYRHGSMLDLQLLESDESYTKSRRNNKEFKIATRNFQSFTPEGEQMETLKELAEEGYFDRHDVQRHNAHWRILSKAEWTNQNGAEVLEAILDAGSGNGTILGNRANRDSLEGQLNSVREQIAKHYHYSLKEQNFKHIITDPNREDLRGADLSELENTIRNTLNKNKKAHLIIKSPHGSAKTTEIIPILTKLAEESLGRSARVLYICTLRSIIRGTSKELGFECYINEGGEIQKHIITTADRLGICIKSLIHTEEAFDVVIRDEAESIGLWSAWSTDSDTLRDYSYLNSIATHPKCIINCLMDADAAELTYAQLDRNLLSENDDSILMENTRSWIKALDQTIHWMRKPRLVLNQIYDDAVIDNKLCFVHVDFGNKKTNPILTSVVNAFNDLAGYEIAKGFWSGTENDIKNRLTDSPNDYIPELYEQGVRIIIVSPIIVSGWRYKAEPHFDATYGIYQNNTQSALSIVQRTQRVTHVREHYLYVAPASSYTDYEGLMRDIQDELEYMPFEHSVVVRRDDASAKELISMAKAKKNKLMDNVKLHTILYWDSFGGNQKFYEFDEDRLPELDVLTDVIKEAKQAELEKTANLILEDEESLRNLTGYFREYDISTSQWVEMYPPNTTEDVIRLLRIREDDAITHDTAKMVSQLLQSTEKEWQEWDLYGAPWNKPDIEEIALLDDFTNPNTYRVLGKILKELERQLNLSTTRTLWRWISGEMATPIVIEVNSLSSEYFDQILSRYHNLLKTNVPELFSKGITRYDKFIEILFKKVLLCKVTTSNPSKEGVKVPDLKRKLVEHYQNIGVIGKGKTTDRRLHTGANSELAERIRKGFELSDIEQEYFDNTGKIIKIELPKYRTLHRMRIHKIPTIITIVGENESSLIEPIYEINDKSFEDIKARYFEGYKRISRGDWEEMEKRWLKSRIEKTH